MAEARALLLGDLPLGTRTLELFMDTPGVRVVAVVAQHPGREFTNDPWADATPLAAAAELLDLPVLRSPREAIEAFEPGSLDLGMSCRASWIYRRDFLDLFRGPLVNMHGGLLPARRGLNIACHSILEGDRWGGATLHRIDETIDTGDILARDRFPIGPEDTAHTVYQRTQLLLLDLIRAALPSLLDGTAHWTPQTDLIAAGESIRSFARGDLESWRQVDLRRMSDDEVLRRIRAFDFPGHEPAWADIGGRRVHLSLAPEERTT